MWAGGSVALEWTYGDGLAIERALPLTQVPAPILRAAEAHAQGGRLVKAEVVDQWSGRTYEVRFEGPKGRGTIELREGPAGGVTVVP